MPISIILHTSAVSEKKPLVVIQKCSQKISRKVFSLRCGHPAALKPLIPNIHPRVDFRPPLLGSVKVPLACHRDDHAARADQTCAPGKERFVADSPLEEAGFEPSVPHRIGPVVDRSRS
jgi:hypothetical protein